MYPKFQIMSSFISLPVAPLALHFPPSHSPSTHFIQIHFLPDAFILQQAHAIWDHSTKSSKIRALSQKNRGLLFTYISASYKGFCLGGHLAWPVWSTCSAQWKGIWSPGTPGPRGAVPRGKSDGQTEISAYSHFLLLTPFFPGPRLRRFFRNTWSPRSLWLMQFYKRTRHFQRRKSWLKVMS